MDNFEMMEEITALKEKLEHEKIKRKMAEQKYQKLKSNYDAILKDIPIGIYIVDQKGKVLYVNEMAYEISGVVSEEFENLGWAKLLHPDDRDNVLTEWEKSLKNRKMFRMQYRFLRPDGSITWVIGQGVHYHNQDETLFLGTLSDITDRIELQKQMTSLEKLEYIVSQHPDITFLIDNDGIILDANILVQQELGYSIEELLGKKIIDYIHEREFFRKQLNNAIKGKLTSESFHFIYPSGKLKELSIKLLPIFKNEERIKYIFITAKLENGNHILDGTKKKLLKVIESRKEIICIISEEGIIQYVSPSCKNLSGYDPEDILGTNHKRYTHEKDFPTLEKILNTLSNDEHPTYTYRFRRKDGVYIWKESTFQGVFDQETSKLIEIIAISREVTDRKQVEKRLKQNEKNFRVMVEQSPSGVFVFKKGKWLYANKTAVKMLSAKSRGDIIGKGIYSFVSPIGIESFKEAIKEIYRGRKMTSIESKWMRMDGSKFDVEVVGYPIIYKDKTAYQLVVRDVTEKNEMRKLAIMSEKLNTIGELAAGMAHEIRNPLTSLSGFLQLIRRGSHNDKYYDIMESELERIEMIVSQLLLSSKPQDVVGFSLMNIQSLVNEVMVFLEPEAILHNVTIKKKTNDTNPILINCNPFQIKQVIINMIKNAVEAMPSGGLITILIARKGEGQVSIKISDQGVGVPEDKLALIGQPFYTTKENGTGLGMMVSYSIIQNHHGTISIESKEGKGTTFEILLPLEQ